MTKDVLDKVVCSTHIGVVENYTFQTLASVVVVVVILVVVVVVLVVVVLLLLLVVVVAVAVSVVVVAGVVEQIPVPILDSPEFELS